jgi:hypothetical protein
MKIYREYRASDIEEVRKALGTKVNLYSKEYTITAIRIRGDFVEFQTNNTYDPNEWFDADQMFIEAMQNGCPFGVEVTRDTRGALADKLISLAKEILDANDKMLKGQLTEREN